MKGKRRIIAQDEMHVLFVPEVEFSPEEREEAARNGGALGGPGVLARYFFALVEAMGVPTRREVEQWADECDTWLAANGSAHEPLLKAGSSCNCKPVRGGICDTLAHWRSTGSPSCIRTG